MQLAALVKINLLLRSIWNCESFKCNHSIFHFHKAENAGPTGASPALGLRRRPNGEAFRLFQTATVEASVSYAGDESNTISETVAAEDKIEGTTGHYRALQG